MSATERLPMLDEFGSRARIIPAEVRGPLRTWRNRVHAFLLLLLVALPWLRINGMQAVWLDIPRRRFEIFGVLFLSHDAPLLFFIAMLLILALVIVTALFGRVWCGWACPQTVFIDAVYRRIEIWIEGDYIKRRKLAAQPMSFEKAAKLCAKWALYFAVSFMISHSVMAYFAGAKNLILMMQGAPAENWVYFLVSAFLTTLLMFNFGWFREQFCVIMCPYGRFQNVLMDENTVAVMYDEKRGEPRKGLAAAVASATRAGDCVSCNRCVQVCPTKIDIRDGLQMECISCTACVDACNEIMRKVNKPEGLIRHKRISEKAVRGIRPRVAAYSALGALFLAGLVYSLATRKDFSLTVLRATDIPYQLMQDGRVLNHFKNHYLNQSVEEQPVEFILPREEQERGIELTQAVPFHMVPPGGAVEPHLFISFPRGLLGHDGEVHFKILVRNKRTGAESAVEVKGIGPYSGGS